MAHSSGKYSSVLAELRDFRETLYTLCVDVHRRFAAVLVLLEGGEAQNQLDTRSFSHSFLV